MTNENDGLRKAIISFLLGEDIATAEAQISAATGFELSAEQNKPFSELTNWTNDRPNFIAEWRQNEECENKKYGRFTTGIQACSTGYKSSLYHLENIKKYERIVHKVLEKFDFKKDFSKENIAAIGDLSRIDFEYHAFVMSYRRSLDGLAWGLSTYFKSSQSSFNKFMKDLPKYHPLSVATELASVCNKHAGNFDFVIGKERGLSVRDRIAHREAVQSGTINLGVFGHRIIGGGENLGLHDITNPTRLSHVLDERLENLHSCIGDILRTFRCAVSSHEANI